MRVSYVLYSTCIRALSDMYGTSARNPNWSFETPTRTRIGWLFVRLTGVGESKKRRAVDMFHFPFGNSECDCQHLGASTYKENDSPAVNFFLALTVLCLSSGFNVLRKNTFTQQLSLCFVRHVQTHRSSCVRPAGFRRIQCHCANR